MKSLTLSFVCLITRTSVITENSVNSIFSCYGDLPQLQDLVSLVGKVPVYRAGGSGSIPGGTKPTLGVLK